MLVPADVLWEIIERAETIPSWLPVCDRCEVIEGTGLGRRQRMFVHWGRREAAIDQQVIEFVPPSRLRWKHVQERFGERAAPHFSSETTMTIELRPAGAVTTVVLTSRSVPASPWAALVLRLTAARRIARAFDRALRALAVSGEDA